MRTESRGLHYRTDYLEIDNDYWLKKIAVKQVKVKMKLFTKPVVVTKMELPKGKMMWNEYIVKAVLKLKEPGV